MPFTRMRVHRSTGACTYNDPREVKEELVKRGLIEPTPALDTEETGLEKRLSMAIRAGLANGFSGHGPRGPSIEGARLADRLKRKYICIYLFYISTKLCDLLVNK